MFRRLTSLLFGGDEDICTGQRTSKPAEILEEGWLLVNHQEAVNELKSVEEQVVDCANTSNYRFPLGPPVSKESEPTSETDTRRSEPEVPGQRCVNSPSRVIRGTVSMTKVMQVARVQWAQTRVDLRHLTRSSIKQQNCVRHRAHRHCSVHTTYLQQPRQHNFSH